MIVDILCFSHLRWNFVYQRPQHLLTRFAKEGRVFFFEEPVFDADSPHCIIHKNLDLNVYVVTPHLPNGSVADVVSQQAIILDCIIQDFHILKYISWYYSPMALPFSAHINPMLLVYDCMDELSAFRHTPRNIAQMESRLMAEADIVFTGGNNLYLAKKDRHPDVHAFPSSIDKSHFMRARKSGVLPEDVRHIPGPQFGFYGVLDERFDFDLLSAVADLKPDWNFVLIGPIAKIDREAIPKRRNIHYLGAKPYQNLPDYLASWDVAVMPFALNEATRFISPTKTPEFLAAGKRVISTSIHDVVCPYGELGLVEIADTPSAFIEAGYKLLHEKDDALWLKSVDTFLADMSWDKTWQAMKERMSEAFLKKKVKEIKKPNAYV